MLGTRTVLGLAMEDDAVTVAEVRIRSGRPEVQRVGHWSFKRKLNSDNAKDIGLKLREFLRTNHFSSKQAAIGIPTKWVVAKTIVAPAASAEALAGILGIQAERAFSLNVSDLVFDYCGHADASQKSDVLLVAARREIISQIGELVTAAGLQIRSVTVSALTLAAMDSQAGPDLRYGLYSRPTYCEFWAQANGSPRSIQHVPTETKTKTEDEQTELLTSTIQRLVMLSSQQGDAGPYRVTVYNGCGLSNGFISRLNERLRPQITATLDSALEIPDANDEAQSAAAAAVAITAAGRDECLVNFLNPRIGAPKKVGHRRVTLWAAAMGAACLLAVAVVIADWQADTRDIATYSKQLDLMSDDIAAAKELVNRISYASSWTSQQPAFLNCLRELTLTFPQEPTIWATNLRLSENAGALVGKAVDEESFYQVLDKIKQDKAFSNVQMIHIRNAGRDSGEKEFAVNFEFHGLKEPQNAKKAIEGHK
jgi:Type IV pilus assembly protein PilM